MNKRGVMAGGAAAALAGFVAVGGAAADQFEENDSCLTAAAVGNGFFTNLDVGHADPDYYHITVPFSNQLIVEIEHDFSFGDIDLFLYDECGGSLEAFSVDESNFETIFWTNTTADTEVYLHVAFVDFFEDFNFYSLFIEGADGGGPACACDLDGTPGVDVFDLLAYLDLWFPSDPAADIDGAAGVDVFDLLAFLDCWFPASAGGAC